MADSIQQLEFIDNFELFDDYHYYYKEFARQFISGEWTPYIENAELASFDYPLIYPPFFLYVITLPAFISSKITFIPLFLANCLVPLLIYKFLGQFHTKKVAEWGLLATALSPILILYTGSLFLNTSLVILSFTLTLYCIAKKNYNLAIILLGISLLFKQITLFFILPIILFIILK
ncbi:MAG: hypothetical protein ACOC4M_09310, partial [Promethearchaeia archaeon]